MSELPSDSGALAEEGLAWSVILSDGIGFGIPDVAGCDSHCLPGWRPAGMSKALSLDLRVRVQAAVAGGLSHRAAGGRFGVSAASVSRWRTREREQGYARPKALGGDRKSHRIDAHRNYGITVTVYKLPFFDDPALVAGRVRRHLPSRSFLSEWRA